MIVSIYYSYLLLLLIICIIIAIIIIIIITIFILKAPDIKNDFSFFFGACGGHLRRLRDHSTWLLSEAEGFLELFRAFWGG